MSVNHAVKKQGSYGKILEHKHTLYEQLSRPREVAAVAYYCCAHSSGPLVRSCCPWGPRRNRDEIFCEGVLAHVSRSFATLIMELPPALRRSVMVFYLVLRGLDTVEDDMEAFAGAPGEKLRHLRAFHTYLAQPEWCLRGVGQGRERELLERFPALLRVYARLPPAHAAVIRDVAQQMGEGMACFAERNLAEGTRDTEDYDLYCHYVAGLVGDGLTRLWHLEGVASARVASEHLREADDMGKFLQKTNIIRDYLEDLVDGRAFWPRDVWGPHADALGGLRDRVAAGDTDAPLRVLNALVADALKLVPSVMRYLEGIEGSPVFAFCAIPQCMAIATLAALAHNPRVFTGVVKIRKGAALLIMERVRAGGIDAVREIFCEEAAAIFAAVPHHHGAAATAAAAACAALEAGAAGPRAAAEKAFYCAVIAVATLLLLAYLYTGGAGFARAAHVHAWHAAGVGAWLCAWAWSRTLRWGGGALACQSCRWATAYEKRLRAYS